MEANLRTANGFLASLNANEFELIRPYLRTLELRESAILVEVGQPFTNVFLPHSGIVSLVVKLVSGERIEVAMVGRDSLLGAFCTLGDPNSLGEATVLMPGVASLLSVDRLRAAVDQSEHLRRTLVRHGQAVFAQAQQSAACNASHSVEARLARCLLRVHDLSGRMSFTLTQETMAHMIGSGRNAVSYVAHSLQKSGLIHYSRGHIEILDLGGLQENACECYFAVRTQCERLLAAAP